MSKLEELRERGLEAKRKIESFKPILAKKEEIPENFGGRETLRINSASRFISSVEIMLNHHLRQAEIYIEDSLDAGELEADFENYLNRLEGEIPKLEETVNLEPAERAITPREALVKIEALNDECDLLHQAVSDLGVKYEDRLPSPPRKRV